MALPLTVDLDLEPAPPPQATKVPVFNLVLDADQRAALAAQDHDVFELVFDCFHAPIYRYVAHVMGDTDDAHEMTQDVFLKAYLALPRVRDPQTLKVGAWLYRIATNRCMDELRHRKLVRWQPLEALFAPLLHFASGHQGDSMAINRHGHKLVDQSWRDNPLSAAVAGEKSALVQQVIGRMHPKYRMCLVLREYHGLSYDEIAEVLSTTRAAVKSLLFRARGEFRELIHREPAYAALLAA